MKRSTPIANLNFLGSDALKEELKGYSYRSGIKLHLEDYHEDRWEGKAEAVADLPKGWAFYAYTGWSRSSYDQFKKYVDRHMTGVGEKHGIKKYRIVHADLAGPRWWVKQHRTGELVLTDHAKGHNDEENKWCVIVWVGRAKDAPKVVQHDRETMEWINELHRETARYERRVNGAYYGLLGYRNYNEW